MYKMRRNGLLEHEFIKLGISFFLSYFSFLFGKTIFKVIFTTLKMGSILEKPIIELKEYENWKRTENKEKIVTTI